MISYFRYHTHQYTLIKQSYEELTVVYMQVASGYVQ